MAPVRPIYNVKVFLMEVQIRFSGHADRIEYLITFINNIMGKAQDAKKNIKKEAVKTPKEKKAEKRSKKFTKG